MEGAEGGRRGLAGGSQGCCGGRWGAEVAELERNNDDGRERPWIGRRSSSPEFGGGVREEMEASDQGKGEGIEQEAAVQRERSRGGGSGLGLDRQGSAGPWAKWAAGKQTGLAVGLSSLSHSKEKKKKTEIRKKRKGG